MGSFTDNIRIMSGTYTNDSAQSNVINYVLRNAPDSPFGGCAVYPINPTNTDKQFQAIKDKYSKISGRQIFHLCITYPDNTPQSRQQALIDAEKASQRLGKEFQNVYGLHEDTKKSHVHFAINSVSYRTGKKITSEYIYKLLADV